MLDNAWYVDGATGVAVTDLGGIGGTAGATATISGLTVPAGALIVVIVSEVTSGSAGTLADGAGNTYSTATSGAMSGAAGFGMVFYVANCSALTSQNIVYTKQTSGRAASLSAFYATGIATSTPLDATVTATSAVNSATPTVTGGAPAQSGELIVGACSYSNAAAKTLTNSGSFVTPFANITSQATASVGGGHINVGGSGAVTFTPTLSGASDNRTMIVGFKAASAATGWWGVTQWSNHTAVAGELIRQSATPTVGSERVFVCTTAGATGATEPTWTTTRGALTTSSSAVYQEATGVAALNGDLTNTPTWAQMRAASTTATLGQVIQRNSGASYQICTISGTVGASEPVGFSNTAGVTTADNTATWTSLGVVGGFTTIFAAPHARLGNAYTSTWGAAGNSFYAHSTHSEVQTTAMTLTSPGTLASPTSTASVGTGAVPPTSVTAGATITAAGASNIQIAGVGYYAGITYLAGTGASTASLILGSTGTVSRFQSCGFTLNNTSASSRLNLNTSSGGTGIDLQFDTCTFTFGSAVGQTATASSGNVLARINGSTFAVGANVPTTLFTTWPSSLWLTGVDLSAFGSGKTLFAATAAAGQQAMLQDCKRNASVTTAATPTQMNSGVYVVRTDSAATNYQTESYSYTGTLTTDIVTVRTGGASAGTPISWKVIPTTNAKWILPFECPPIRTVINSRVSQNVTVAIPGTWSGGALPTNRDCWMRIEYLGTSGFPLGVFNSGTVASNLVSSSPQTADTTSVWGAGGTTNFRMVTTLSAPQPLIAGYFNVVIYVGANSGTFWFDPLVSLT